MTVPLGLTSRLCQVTRTVTPAVPGHSHAGESRSLVRPGGTGGPKTDSDPGPVIRAGQLKCRILRTCRLSRWDLSNCAGPPARSRPTRRDPGRKPGRPAGQRTLRHSFRGHGPGRPNHQNIRSTRTFAYANLCWSRRPGPWPPGAEAVTYSRSSRMSKVTSTASESIPMTRIVPWLLLSRASSLGRRRPLPRLYGVPGLCNRDCDSLHSRLRYQNR